MARKRKVNKIKRKTTTKRRRRTRPNFYLTDFG